MAVAPSSSVKGAISEDVEQGQPGLERRREGDSIG